MREPKKSEIDSVGKFDPKFDAESNQHLGARRTSENNVAFCYTHAYSVYFVIFVKYSVNTVYNK